MLSLNVQYATKRTDIPDKKTFRRWIKATLQTDAQIVLRLVDEDEGRNLNRDYRGKNHPTNVLTFTYDDMEILTGDIVICAPVVAREAAEQSKSIEAHYAHLTIHGILHLQGYDHENDLDAAKMEALESKIVMSLGYPDPYLT